MNKMLSYIRRIIVNLFWLLPLLIVISIWVGFRWNISDINDFTSSNYGQLLDISALKKLEVLPCLTLVFSIYLIGGIIIKIVAYKKTFPHKRIKGLRSFVIFCLRLPRQLFIPLTAYWMLLFWSIGWGLYICALWSNYSSDGNLAEILGYAAMASLDMFLLDINGNILDNIGKSIDGFNASVIKGGIIITSIFAAFSSFAIVIKLFLNRLISTLHASKAGIDDNHNHIYIFWGINSKSIALANSIKKHDSRNYIIYIEPLDSESDEIDGVANIVNYVSPSKSKIESIDLDERTLYLYSTADLTEVKTDENLWSHIGLDQADRLFKELSVFTPQKMSDDNKNRSGADDIVRNQIHIFFISEDRDTNISNAISTVENFIILSGNNVGFKDIEKTIYCQTRRDSVTSVIEDSRTNLNNNIEVVVIDESVLAIERIKEDIDLHPVNFVDIELKEKRNICTVKNELTSLIIGFGETGRDSFRFLYEFGAFLSPNHDMSIRSAFHCHVVDSKMSELEAHFKKNTPAIFQQDNPATVDFYEASDKSSIFYNLLESISSKLNFIVVAAGDDETNITIAVNVLKYIRRTRENLDKLVILVRAYNQDSFSHLNGIANHYNRVLKKEAKGHTIFKIFGQVEEIFTYDNIIANTFKRKAINFYEAYDSAYVLTEEGISYGGERTSWQKRRKDALASNKLCDIEDLRRKESQDFSNAWHALTKLHIIDAVLAEYCGNTFDICHAKLLAEKMFNQDGDIPVREIHPTEITYPKLDHQFEENFKSIISILMTNLAKTEHLRWVAAHESLGYVFGERIDTITKRKISKDIIHKWHSCMVPWERLELLPASSTRLYDYLVIETTLKLLENENQ